MRPAAAVTHRPPATVSRGTLYRVFRYQGALPFPASGKGGTGVVTHGVHLQQCVTVKTFDELWAELSAKADQGTPGSGTVALLARGVHAVGKKVVEEAAEAWMAAEHESEQRAAEEIAQLLYHAQVLMLAKGLELRDVYRHL